MAQIHHVPGRLRVRIAAVKRNSAIGRSVERAIRSVHGVLSARSNELTGSVVVEYDCRETTADLILEAIGNSGWHLEPAVRTQLPQTAYNPALGRIAGKAVQAVAWCLLEKAVERSVPILITALL